MCLPAAQCITHHSDGPGAAVGRLHGSLVMKYVLLQLLIWHTCCARWHWYPHICSVPFAHAALLAHMLGCLDDAAVGLCITQNFDLNEVKYVLLQLMLLTWHLLRSLASATQCCSAAHMLRWLPQDDTALYVCTAAGRHE